MKSYFDHFETQLHTAAQARIATTHRAKRRSAWRIVRAAPVMLAIAVSFVIGGGALLILHAHHSPGRPQPSTPAAHSGAQAGSQPPVAGDPYTAVAFNTAYQVRGCSPAARAQANAITQGSPGKTMLTRLPLLTRRPGPADQLPRPFAQQLRLRRSFGPIAGGAYIHYVRRARIYRGISLYVIPLAHVGQPAVPVAVAERCYQAAARSLREQTSHLSAAVRRRILRNGLHQFATWAFNLTHQSVHEGVFLLASMPNGSAGGTRDTLTTITQRGLLGATSQSNGSMVWYGIVPSAAHIVTLEFPGGRQQNKYLPPITVSDVTINNVFIFSVPDSGPGRRLPTTMTWRSAAGGQIIKRITETSLNG